MIPIVKYARPAGRRRSRPGGARPVDPARPEGPARPEEAVLSLRARVLTALAGPEYRPVHAIPHRWPVQRGHVRRVVRMLWEEGRLERRPGPGGGERWLYRTVRGEGVTRP
jgi:hypothetical protein